MVDSGRSRLEGRAWSGRAPVERVEISDDAGATWADARLGPLPERFAWRSWLHDARPGEHELLVRATDGAGESQPTEQPWNHHGLANNMVQRVAVTVRGT